MNKHVLVKQRFSLKNLKYLYELKNDVKQLAVCVLALFLFANVGYSSAQSIQAQTLTDFNLLTEKLMITTNGSAVTVPGVQNVVNSTTKLSYTLPTKGRYLVSAALNSSLPTGLSIKALTTNPTKGTSSGELTLSTAEQVLISNLEGAGNYTADLSITVTGNPALLSVADLNFEIEYRIYLDPSVAYEVTLTTDFTIPTVAVTTPAAGTVLFNKTVMLSGSAADSNSDIDSVDIYEIINGVEHFLGTATLNATGSNVTWNYPLALTYRPVTLKIYSFDSSGNQSKAASLTLTPVEGN